MYLFTFNNENNNMSLVQREKMMKEKIEKKNKEY